MKIPFRIKLILLWYKIFRNNLEFKSIKKISRDSKGVNNILFFLPAEKEFAQVSSHFIKSNYQNNFSNINFVVHEKGLPFYQDELLPRMIIFSDDDINWLGAISSEEIINRINLVDYDALVDLNQTINQPLSLLSIDLDIPNKIGFETPISHLLFSIEIELKENGFIEENYIMIENILGIN